MGTEIEITPEIIAHHLQVPNSGIFNESEHVPIEPFPDDSPTHLHIHDRLLHLFTTWFFRPSGGRCTKMHQLDYWWLYHLKSKNRPHIAKIIFITLVKIISNPSKFSLSYGCVLSHIFDKLGVDTSLDPPIPLKSKINLTTTKKTGWMFENGEWTHKRNEDEARIHEQVPAPDAPPPITLDSMYAMMVTRFDNMDAHFHSLEGRVASLEHDVHAIYGHLFPHPPPSPHDDPDA